jgi:hypothetical protein
MKSKIKKKGLKDNKKKNKIIIPNKNKRKILKKPKFNKNKIRIF